MTGYRGIRAKGDLRKWQKIARLAIGNSRLMLALALAFVGPVGPILEVEQVGIQLFGPQGCGETATLIAAGSVWGKNVDPELAASVGFGSLWNSTTNDSEQELLDPIIPCKHGMKRDRLQRSEDGWDTTCLTT